MDTKIGRIENILLTDHELGYSRDHTLMDKLKDVRPVIERADGIKQRFRRIENCLKLREEIRNTKVRSRKFFDLSEGKAGVAIMINNMNLQLRSHHRNRSLMAVPSQYKNHSEGNEHDATKKLDLKQAIRSSLRKKGGERHTMIDKVGGKPNLQSLIKNNIPLMADAAQKRHSKKVNGKKQEQQQQQQQQSRKLERPQEQRHKSMFAATHAQQPQRNKSMYAPSSKQENHHLTLQTGASDQSPIPPVRRDRIISPFNTIQAANVNELSMESWEAHNEKVGNSYSPLTVGNQSTTSPFNENATDQTKQAAIARLTGGFSGVGGSKREVSNNNFAFPLDDGARGGEGQGEGEGGEGADGSGNASDEKVIDFIQKLALKSKEESNHRILEIESCINEQTVENSPNLKKMKDQVDAIDTLANYLTADVTGLFINASKAEVENYKNRKFVSGMGIRPPKIRIDSDGSDEDEDDDDVCADGRKKSTPRIGSNNASRQSISLSANQTTVAASEKIEVDSNGLILVGTSSQLQPLLRQIDDVWGVHIRPPKSLHWTIKYINNIFQIISDNLTRNNLLRFSR